MTIPEAIEKAVEGGYHIYGSDGMDTSYEGANSEYSVWTRQDNDSSFLVLTEKTFLDPQFWQALGCVLVQPGGKKKPFCTRSYWAILTPYTQTTLPKK